jgi:hypothetical protein
MWADATSTGAPNRDRLQIDARWLARAGRSRVTE